MGNVGAKRAQVSLMMSRPVRIKDLIESILIEKMRENDLKGRTPLRAAILSLLFCSSPIRYPSRGGAYGVYYGPPPVVYTRLLVR